MAPLAALNTKPLSDTREDSQSQAKKFRGRRKGTSQSRGAKQGSSVVEYKSRSNRKEDPVQQAWKQINPKPKEPTVLRLEVQIRNMVEQGNISEARRLISWIPDGVSPSLDRWRRLLAEPVVSRGAPASGKNSRADFLWIQRNADRYKGQWVAIKDGILLGSNRSRLLLHKELKRLNILEGATFYKVQE